MTLFSFPQCFKLTGGLHKCIQSFCKHDAHAIFVSSVKNLIYLSLSVLKSTSHVTADLENAIYFNNILIFPTLLEFSDFYKTDLSTVLEAVF